MIRPILSIFLLVLTISVTNAQDTIHSLVITEARMNQPAQAYVELTNMSDEAINLAEFEFGRVDPTDKPQDNGDWFMINENQWMMLPNESLKPGESFVLGTLTDWLPLQRSINPFMHDRILSKNDIAPHLDYGFHIPEAPVQPDPFDSVSENYQIMEICDGKGCWYLRHHLSNGDSVIIDRVGVTINDYVGNSNDGSFADVAGFEGATGFATLVRKFSIKHGNPEFNSGRGTNPQNSEWIVIPFLGENEGERASFWTIGNHGNYLLNDTTLTSETLAIDWDNNIITVPWGVRRDDSLMFQFDHQEGFAWHYEYVANHEDSAYLSARTGDSITIYAAGDSAQFRQFYIQVEQPDEDANIVVPKHVPNKYGYFEAKNMGQYDGFCNATDGNPKMDTILSMNGITGIPFNTRVDSLLKYIEFPANARYELEFIAEEVRADLIDGDILRVTSSSGNEKEYYIKVDDYRPAHNAQLSAITWPDIQDERYHPLLVGWKQDTIPDFNPSTFYYTLELPTLITQVPALTCHTQDVNATVEIKPAQYLNGPPEDRTYTFTVTAEDDTTVLEYKLLLKRTDFHEHVQPFMAEPFVSQWVYRDHYNTNYIEICNPGEGGVDLTNYMFYHGPANTAEEAITEVPEDYDSRYRKYIPRKKWQARVKWSTEPYMVEPDSIVDPIIGGGDVFVMSRYGSDWPPPDSEIYPALATSNIDFSDNPWNDTLNPEDNVACQEPGANFYMFKILNDSVKNGLKPATDPADFKLIETIGTGDNNTTQFISGIDLNKNQSYIRKPEYGQPKALWGASFGTEETSEWMLRTPEYYAEKGYNWPANVLMLTNNIGSHQFYELTYYKSTVDSRFYKVDYGYVGDLKILGVVEGETVDEVSDKLIKADEDQTLTFISAADGTILTGDDVVLDGDSLIILSADTLNTTKYILDVTAEGLSDDALLRSEIFNISIDDTTGAITSIQTGFTLREVKARMTIPAGASFYITHDDGWLVPLQKRNFNASWRDVIATNHMNFKVVAEDGATTITYDLIFDGDSADTYILSDVYQVNQQIKLVANVPEGTTVSTFLKNVIIPPGATAVITDKNGLERHFGELYKDDMIGVTAANEINQEIYYISFLKQPTDYMAYIYPGAYEVDQWQQTIIFCNSIQLTVYEFLSISLLSPGATAIVYNKNGEIKADSQFLEPGDEVKVISGDEKYSRTYVVVITSCVGIEDNKNEQFNIFPNPTSGSVTIEYLPPETKIQVFNSTGRFILNRFAPANKEVISLDGKPAGMYFIIISNEKDILGSFKVMVE